MTSGVYGIFCPLTGQCLYVGQSINIESRWKSHLKDLRSGKHKRLDLLLWLKTQEIKGSNLYFKILEKCTENLLNSREIFWFYELKPKFFGKAPSIKEQWRLTDETKEKISKSLLARFEGQSLRDRQLTCSLCGKKFSSTRKNALRCSTKCYAPFTSKEDLYALYVNSQLSMRAIAKKFNVSHITVRNELIRHGIAIAPHGSQSQSFIESN